MVSALAYLLGKTLVYTVIGLAVILASQPLAQSSIPLIIAARKALGLLMLVIGLAFLGLVRLIVSVGHGLSGWLQERTGGGL